jgi:hypothetical protein
MQVAVQRSPSQPAVVLGLTFLVMGLTFALPFQLLPEQQRTYLSSHFSQEVANVYAVVAWMGWAHFIFAFRGQGGALARLRDGFRNNRIAGYIGAVAITVAVLASMRWAIGPAIFGAGVWVYFIDHFLKAEQSFEGKQSLQTSIVGRWLSSYQSILTFGWLTAVLMNVGNVNSRPWILWGVSLLLGVGVLAFGGWRNLARGNSRSPLLSLFFVAEALVWGTFSRYGGPMFLTGVYVFHVAAGSYFHYFGSYFYAASRSQGKDRFLNPLAIAAINFALIAIGVAVAQFPSLWWLNPIVGPQWFTLWVGVHLVTSDLFPPLRAWRQAKLAA